MSWPSGTDPFYLANTTENNARRAYYDVNATPTQECDGSAASWSSIQSIIQARMAVASPLWMDETVQVANNSITVTVRAVSDISITSGHVIHFALLDRYSNLPNSPNGQPNHYHAMLDMAPSASGQPFTAGVADTVTYSASFPINPAWDLGNCDLASFVQNSATREVLQAICIEMPITSPYLVMQGFEVSDVTGNGDGRVDPGETGELVATLADVLPFHDAEQVVATLSTDDPLIQITTGTVNFPNIPSGGSAANSDSPFVFVVDPTFTAHEVTFTLTVNAEPEAYQVQYPITFMVGRPDLLLVNDDVSGNYQSYYDNALDSLGRIHDVWDQHASGLISETELLSYASIIWYTGGDATSSVLSDEEQQRIEGFLSQGGRLLLSSQNAGDVLGGMPFYENVLHAQHLANSVGYSFPIQGVSGDPVSDGTIIMPLGGGGAGNANSCANLNALAPAVGLYTYSTAAGFAALRYEGVASKLIYTAFPLEATANLPSFTPLWQILDNCLTWLESPVAVAPGNGSAALPDRLEILAIHPNPFNPSAEIDFTLPAAAAARFEVFNLRGERVESVVTGALPSGRHELRWNADSRPSGIYLIKLTAGNVSVFTKAILLK